MLSLINTNYPVYGCIFILFSNKRINRFNTSKGISFDQPCDNLNVSCYQSLKKTCYGILDTFHANTPHVKVGIYAADIWRKGLHF